MPLRPTALALLAAASLTLTTHAADSVIARAGDRDITVSQIQPYLSSLSEADRAALKQNPTALSQAVRTLILQQVLLKEASNADWDDKPETQALLARVRDAAIAESYLESVTKLPADFPSDAEIKQVYDARKAELTLPKQYKLAQIFIANGTDPAKAKAKADALAKQVKSGDFAALAKSNSDEPRSAANGGEVGLLPEDSIQPAIRKALTGLAKGTTAGPIELGDGHYFVKILDIQDPRTATLDEVKPQIVTALRTERQKLNRQAYLQRLQSQAPITLDEIALPALLKPEEKK
jgi:parvulin-like peptidyl-prolyl isomerase